MVQFDNANRPLLTGPFPAIFDFFIFINIYAAQWWI